MNHGLLRTSQRRSKLKSWIHLTMQKKNYRDAVPVVYLLRYFFVAATRFLKRSTRPPWSRTFSSPVKNGWQELQISTSIFGIVEPTTNFSPHEQVTADSWWYAGWISFFIMVALYQMSPLFAIGVTVYTNDNGKEANLGHYCSFIDTRGSR